MSGQHARLGMSGAHRWTVCAGSVAPGGETSFAAAQGTYAHDIAAQCLKDSSISPTDFLLKRAVVDGHEVECDMEMVEGIRVYLDAVDEDMHPGDEMWVEMSLLKELQSVDEDLGGTADYARYRPSTQELLVADFKYGAGVYVEVKGNKQLRGYALGAFLKVTRLGRKVKQVRVMIAQPRYEGAKPIREEVFKAIELLHFGADLQEAAVRTRLPNPPLVAGEHCKFCPKARTCPELEKKSKALTAPGFSALVQGPALAATLADIPLVKERIKAIEEHAYKLALSGVAIPGWHLVDKQPRRKWVSEGNVIEWAEKNALDPYAPREVLSPAQLEERVKATAPRGKKKEAAAVLEQFVERVSSGTVLVPVSDGRPPVQARVTGANFEAVPALAVPSTY